jgi:hypothetical protein
MGLWIRHRATVGVHEHGRKAFAVPSQPRYDEGSSLVNEPYSTSYP